MAFFLTEKFDAPKPSRLFWICNCVGWGILGLFDALTSMLVGIDLYTGLFAFFLITTINTATCLKLRQLIYSKKLLTVPLSKAWSKLLFYSIILGLISALNIRIPIDLFMWMRDSFPTSTPFYLKLLSNWMSFSILIFIWGLIYVAVKYSNQLNEAKQASIELKLELRNAQLNTLTAQLNPHFLFNALNNIRGLILEDVPRSREMLTRLAEILRYSLLSDKQEFETLDNELGVVRAYLKLASIQYEERLRYVEDIDTALLNCSIPPMLIQMLVENAVKYGIDQTADGGEIKLTILSLDKLMLIHVTNPGNLQSENLESTGLGVKNIQKRLKLLYADTANLSIRQEGDQVISTVAIPTKAPTTNSGEKTEDSAS